MPQNHGNGQGSEADRYQQAATETLEMLDWCIGYFVGIHKDQIASRLASNRRHIKEDLMHEPEEPLPGGDSNQKADSGNGRTPNGEKGGAGQADRYKQAATEALEMLDWSIGYMVGIRKESIAAQFARNRKHVREDLMREPAEPVPTSKE
jgi:hypothetical protein